ncbi:hypothetical protein ANCDUO_23061 [Ancylostoma duodenale]|uniref:Uncharacterized protein n=1 Tax=Ancylostoma duodenale TaxID=51022 RepID=A0A0C2FJI2_9BILA|nr:hypothetical protein ANCDUO_23061 [Ancylostoma duodenale]
MISILPVQVLAQAKKAGYDVDSLETVEIEGTMPVYDASNNRMNFLGGVRLDVKVIGGQRSMIAFFVSDQPDDEVLLGTNALEILGVHTNIITGKDKETTGTHTEDDKMRNS